ncbi:hypothetical protein jhhlp_002793 [Lomentospora prolificans]|uniref:DUF676 domain-containing protein n=1 Tax=Lomentospora prolificans TaxID=41688 RepID=A0A2N3NF21_9PEZI|nr:hypothetical protein jhhlp_002793 [Lomentospora prolificans]
MRTLSLRRLSSQGTRLLKRALSPEPHDLDDEDGRNPRNHSASLFGRIDPPTDGAAGVTSELKVVHDPVLGTAPTVDIVAVHGLGDGFDGWESTQDGLCWLTSLLHRDVPTARILTFRHSPDLLTPNLAVKDALYERAERLLEALKELYGSGNGGERRPTPPLVFISHSLGGLIVQRALVTAEESQDAASRRVFLATRGMIYFGVPARTQLQRVLGDVSRLLQARSGAARKGRARDGKGWGPDAVSLEAGLRPFDEIADRLHAVSVCFCEALPTAGLKGQMVVDIGSTTSAAERVLLQRSHVDLMRFNGREDEGYTSLREWLGLILAGVVPLPSWLAPEYIAGVADSKTAASASSSLQTLTEPLQVYNDVSFLRTDFDIRPEYPSPSPYHVRHGLLEELAAQFKKLSKCYRVACIALIGYQDVGKSFLAQHFARLTGKAGDRAVFWLDGSSRETLSVSYLELGRSIFDYYWAKYSSDTLLPLGDCASTARARLRAALGFADIDSLLDGKAFNQLDQIAVTSSIKAVLNWLMRDGNDRWMLVLENVGDVADLLDFLPLTLNGWILLVPQKREFEIGLLGMGRLEVPIWTEEDAYELLLAETGREHHPCEEQAGFDIVHSLDYRPSLIHQTAAYIRERGISFHDYYSTDGLATSALANLEEHPGRDQLADVLGIASLLSDAPIPLDLLISVENAIGARLSTDTGGAWWIGSSTAQVRPRLTETLKNLDLIIQTSSPSLGYVLPHTIRVHFLQAPSPRHAWLALSALSSAIHRQTLFDSPTLPELHALSRSLLPHARALYPLALQLSDAAYTPEKRDPKRVDWHLIGQLAATQGDSSLAIKWLEFALHRNSARPEESLDPTQELETVLSLAQLYRQHGDVPRYDELLRSAHLTNDMRYTNPDLYFRARLSLATHLAEKSLLDHAALELDDLSRLYSADDHTSTLSRSRHILSLHSLAVILKMAGRLDDASSVYSRLHPLYAAHLNASHPTVLDTLEEHAHGLEETLHVHDALSILERTLVARIAALGPTHPSVSLAQAHLAALYQTLLDHDAADAMYRAAMPAMEERLGESHAVYLGAKENLALSFWERAGAVEKGGEEMKGWAVGLLRDVLEVREEIGMGIEAEATRERLREMMADHGERFNRG